jgi:hypothetical protein
MARTILRKLRGMPTSDGAGVRLTRTIGSPQLDSLDPFLLLDEFKSDDANDYIAGFPDHPHRGFETVTYMIAGHMKHGDHAGHSGDLRPGSVQWMTAGRGIIHSEIPQQEDGLMWGFQLWVNLPAAKKMCEPRYQEIPPEDIPVVHLDDDVVIKVIAGELGDVRGAIHGIAVQPTYLDLGLPRQSRITLPVTLGHHAFVYCFDGEIEAAGEALPTGELAVLGDGAEVELGGGDRGGRALLVAGKPLNEPVARYGPFVMNTREEILQAVHDFQTGRLIG